MIYSVSEDFEDTRTSESSSLIKSKCAVNEVLLVAKTFEESVFYRGAYMKYIGKKLEKTCANAEIVDFDWPDKGIIAENFANFSGTEDSLTQIIEDSKNYEFDYGSALEIYQNCFPNEELLNFQEFWPSPNCKKNVKKISEKKNISNESIASKLEMANTPNPIGPNKAKADFDEQKVLECEISMLKSQFTQCRNIKEKEFLEMKIIRTSTRLSHLKSVISLQNTHNRRQSYSKVLSAYALKTPATQKVHSKTKSFQIINEN